MTLSKAIAGFNKTKYFATKGKDVPWFGHGHMSSCWLNHPRYLDRGATRVLSHGLNQRATLIHLLCFVTALRAALGAVASRPPGLATGMGLPQRGRGEGARHRALGSWIRLCGVAQEPRGEPHGVGQAWGSAS